MNHLTIAVALLGVGAVSFGVLRKSHADDSSAGPLTAQMNEQGGFATASDVPSNNEAARLFNADYVFDLTFDGKWMAKGNMHKAVGDEHHFVSFSILAVDPDTGHTTDRQQSMWVPEHGTVLTTDHWLAVVSRPGFDKIAEFGQAWDESSLPATASAFIITYNTSNIVSLSVYGDCWGPPQSDGNCQLMECSTGNECKFCVETTTGRSWEHTCNCGGTVANSLLINGMRDCGTSISTDCPRVEVEECPVN